MPEFENLEPFLDRNGDRIMPVAPHSIPAHDFVLPRRDARPARPRSKRGQAPEPTPVDDAGRLTTKEMEKAYRDAMKAGRARKKAQDRRNGRTLWGRFLKAVSRMFTDDAKRPKKTTGKPRPAKSSRSSRPSGQGKQPHSRDRSAKSRGQRRSPGADEKPSEQGKDSRQGASRGRSRNRRRGGKPRGETPGGGAAPGRESRPRKKANAQATPKDRPSGAAAPTDGGQRPKRRRSRRNHKPSGNQSGTPDSRQ